MGLFKTNNKDKELEELRKKVQKLEKTDSTKEDVETDDIEIEEDVEQQEEQPSKQNEEVYMQMLDLVENELKKGTEINELISKLEILKIELIKLSIQNEK